MAVSLRGHRILIADDEPIIAFDLALAIEELGAETVVVHDFRAASIVARVEPLSAAVVDLKLKEQLALPVCAVLQCRDIPFVIYTGYPETEAGAYAARVVRKSNAVEAVVEKLAIIAYSKFPKIHRPNKPTLDQRVARSAQRLLAAKITEPE